MTTRAKVAAIPFGNFEIEGLLLNDGTFAIALPQVYSLFDIPQKHGARTVLWTLATEVKALTVPHAKREISLKDLQSIALTVPHAIKTEVNARGLSVLTLKEFDGVMEELAFSGNKEARNFMRLLRGLSLTQLWSDAFGIKFEKEERQTWLKERQAGKFYRRTLTDATKYLIDKGEKLNYGYITLKVYKGCGLCNAYRDYKTVHKDANFRNTLSNQDLRKVAKMEELTADYIIVDGMDIKSSLKKAATYIR